MRLIQIGEEMVLMTWKETDGKVSDIKLRTMPAPKFRHLTERVEV